MTDVSIASILADAAPAAADNAPVDGGAAAPATPAPAPAAPPAGEGQQTQASPFLEAFSTPETRAYIERKGFKDVDALGTSFAHLERRLFDDKTRVLLPDGPDDAEGHARVYAAMGRPETPEGYGLTELAGADPEFSANVAGWLFDIGVPKQGAALLAEKWGEYVSAKATEAATAAQQAATADWTALKAAWGQEFGANTEHFKRATKSFDLSPEDVEGVAEVLGTRRAVEMFAKIGKGFAPDEMITGDAAAKFGMTKDQAEARLKTLRADPAWQKRWAEGGAEERAEFSRLTAITSGAPA